MAKINVLAESNSALWHIILRPFVDERLKEAARAELRRRGRYGEPIAGIPKVEEG